MKQPTKRPTHYTGAAGTLAVAAELSRRNYDTAITLGNTPALDIICASPAGKKFTVQVKSASSPNWVRIRKEHMQAPDNDLYFIIVLVPDDLDRPFVFHVLTHSEVCENYKGQNKKRLDGGDLAPGWDGVPWAFVKRFVGGWKKLPA